MVNAGDWAPTKRGETRILSEASTIQDKKVNAGRYIIYCIPYQDKWTIILNNDLYTWGFEDRFHKRPDAI